MPSQQQYDFKAVNSVAGWSSSQIEQWLRDQPRTVSVENVEKNRAYQDQDVDLVLVRRDLAGVESTLKLEIKADQRGHDTGNFFFETISNVDKGTPGCFMYSQADHLYYHLVVTGELYILQLAQTRDWFLRNMNQFRSSRTRTPLDNGESYETEGRIVSIRKAITAVRPVAIIKDIPAIPANILQPGTKVPPKNR